MADTRTLTLEVTVPVDAYDVMVGALCKAGGYADASEPNARATVLDWARRTVQNVLEADAQAQAQAVVDAAKAKTDAALDAIGELSASQTEGATPPRNATVEGEGQAGNDGSISSEEGDA
jgi:hypothetical protein